MATEKSSLRDDLVKIIIDKLLIGLIILIAGLGANKILEEYKSKQNFTQVLNEQRVEKLSNAWNLINRVGTKAQEIPILYSEMKELTNELSTFNHTGSEEFQELTKIAVNKKNRLDFIKENIQKDEATLFIKENQFWFTEKEYNLLLDFIDINRQYIDAIIQDLPPEETAELKKMVEEKRLNIVSARNLIFEE